MDKIMACKRDHTKIQDVMSELPFNQGGIGRHKCAACAYERGFQDGLNHIEEINLKQVIDSLEESQAGSQRHKSPHAAYAKGYLDGITKSYNP